MLSRRKQIAAKRKAMGALVLSMLGPSHESGCPQQNSIDTIKPERGAATATNNARVFMCVFLSVITAATTQVAANKLKIKTDVKCDLGSSHCYHAISPWQSVTL